LVSLLKKLIQRIIYRHFQLKAISELLDDEPILDEQVLSLLTWSAQYYQFPIGEVMQTALPALLRQGKPMDVLFHLWKIIPCDNAEALLNVQKQQDAYQILKLHPAGTTENILNLSGVETATLKALQKKDSLTVRLNLMTLAHPLCNWHKCHSRSMKIKRKPFNTS
jgi:primosomal protein N' (replication factor Y)